MKGVAMQQCQDWMRPGLTYLASTAASLLVPLPTTTKAAVLME